jgi:predicted Fe-Mo cluster-binding NifX family protein
MKICISSDGDSIESIVNPRFGRCKYFLLIEDESMNVEPVENPAFSAGGGAGIQAAQLVVNKGAKVVLTGDVGPNAFQALNAAGVKIVTGAGGQVKDVIEKFRKGEFDFTGSPSVGSHSGTGR